MHRRTVTTPTASSKVEASRERRAARSRNNNLISSGAGSIGIIVNSESGNRRQGAAEHQIKRALIGAGTLIVGILTGLWITALYHVSKSVSSENLKTEESDKLEIAAFSKNSLRRMRNNITNQISHHHSDSLQFGINDPYTVDALSRNPYLGWQPPLQSPSSDFSWRQCFNIDASSNGTDQPLGCRENPNELGSAPTVNKSWIPDVTMVRTMMIYGKDRDGNTFPPPLDNVLCEDINVQGGKNGDTNKECLIKSKIRPTGNLNSTTVTIYPSNHFGIDGIDERITIPAPKLMCLVYTMASAHANRIRAMRDTWAGGCDGFLAFSTESDPRLPVISLDHEGPESYSNMWQKVRSIWRFVGENYLDGYDWFFIGGDDLFVLPHNLKTYLASLTHKDGSNPRSKEYFVGRRFNAGGNDYFNSGGAGYSLSQATLRKFLYHIDDAEHCEANAHTSTEDVMIARCLRYLGIHITDTRDSKGRERFHPFAPGTHLHWTHSPEDWYEKYNEEWGVLTGEDCCAPDSVSFHYIKKASMVRHMQALIYFCNNENL